MKYAFIGTYPPRQCGIGTFTKNLRSSMLHNSLMEEGNEGFIVAMSNNEVCSGYPEEVKLMIRQDSQRDYLEAAKFINLSGADVCILEHEFGIFGGQNGVYILPLLHRLQIPLIVTLHTIINKPSYTEKAVLQEICKMANKVVVMSNKAVEFLTVIYKVPKSKIALIEHGVPDILFGQKQSKKEYKLDKKKVILTFGFLGRNKGIETVILALPEVVKKYPDVIYIILGKTHPNVIKYSGEEYRIYLMKLVKKFNLEDNVLFLNEFINQQELFKYLSACDIYVTPYLSEAQITSGTLSYAVGVGAAVISTPYWHAAELLDDGRGKLFKFNDNLGLSKIIIELLDNPKELKRIRSNAFEYGRKITWPKIGKKYVEACKQIITHKPKSLKKEETLLDPLILPPFSLEHIHRLTDDTGIIQHAKFGIPNLKDGYCLDDNARALLMVLMAYKQKKNKEALNLAPIYLSYIHYMQNSDGSFRNFLSFNRAYLDQKGSEDSFGRAVWALGYLLGNAPNDAYYQTARDIFFMALPEFEKLKSIRSIADTVIGMSHYLYATPGDEGTVSLLKTLINKLIHQYDNNKTDDWRWFESVMAYDNAILPLSLLHAYRILKDEHLKEVAVESMEFLTEVTMSEGYLSIIGNEKWYEKDKERSLYAQQPVDAMAMVLMFQQAYNLTKEKKYLDNLYTCFMWFLGENDMRMNLYDFETNGCCDGLENYGVNRNQGAESTLAYMISHIALLQAFEEFHESN
jgi:glycosyltransferase involved in cell wall biosynthesis